jgi:CRISPR/Cas system Type II protein with McrA/HNH and RuvC-like nuclease domain
LERNASPKISKSETLGPLTFGFDIGMASVGWAVLSETRIVALGVRCFDPGEDEKGEPHNQKRRNARVARNRLHMRRWRLRQLLRLFCDAGIIDRPDPQLLAMPSRGRGEPEAGPWQLRVKGLSDRLKPLEWAQVLYHMVKHRGFEFFRKSELKTSPSNDTASNVAKEEQPVPEGSVDEASADKEKQKLTKALEDSSKLLSQYRELLKNPHLTIAGLLNWLAQDTFAPGEPRPEEKHRIQAFHNKAGSYRHAFFRTVLRQELRELFAAQIRHQNLHTAQPLSENGQYLKQMLATYGSRGIPIGGESRAVGRTFQQAVFDLFDLQHPPLYAEQIQDMVGECELIEGQPRASKNTFSAERATWLEKLNHLKVRRNGQEDFLTAQERDCLLNLPYDHRVVTLKLVRETLMAQSDFPASWKEASFNVASYRSKPATNGAWIFVASHGMEPLSLAKWAVTKGQKDNFKKAKEMLTGGTATFEQLRRQLDLRDSDRFTYKLKETNIIARDQEDAEFIKFSVEGDGILERGQSFRYIQTDGKPKAFPKAAWKLLNSLRSRSTATLADWRFMLSSSQLSDLPSTWQFEHSIQIEGAVEREDEAKASVPLQFEDAQSVEADHKLVELKGWHALRLALAEHSPDRLATFQLAYKDPTSATSKKLAEDMDKIATILTICQTDQEIAQRLAALNYTQIEIDALQSISFNKFRNLSLEALRKILPHLEDGCVYSKACELAGLSHFEKNVEKRTKYLPPLKTYLYQRYRHGKPTGHIESRYKELRNPVVARSFNQARLVFNDLVAKHGSPAYVHVETARDMARSKKLRDKISREQETNRKRADSLRADLRSRLGHDPSASQLVKMRLYAEQGGQCIYTGASLEPHIDSILHGDEFVEIDHIWPRSKTFDNSLDNRVLVLAGANRDKSNRIPFEFFNGAGGDTRWREFEKRVLSCKGLSAEKQRRLLSKSLEDADEFLARNLVDTRYVTRMFANMLRERIEFAGGATPEELEGISPDDNGTTRWNRYQRARVRSPQGRLVDFLRGKWGLAHAKDRESSDLHHAVDACIIAACTPQVIQRVNNYFAQEEQEPHVHHFKRNSDGTYTLRTGDEIGLIISKAEARERGLYLPAPWDSFHRDLLNALEKIFISRRPKRKSKGELHDANPKGIRYLPVPLTDLTEDMLADECLREIRSRRRENYEALRLALQASGGDPKTVFSDGFEIVGTNGKTQRIKSIGIPLWSLPNDYLKTWKKANKKKPKEMASETKAARKTIPLISLKPKMLTESELGTSFYYRNKDLLEALNAHMAKYGNDAKKAFAEPFRPPGSTKKTGEQRPVMRSIRLPDTHGSGIVVRGGIAGLGDSIATEVYWIDKKGYFFRPRYQVDKEITFGLDEPPANARHLFNLRIDEPIKVILKDGSEVPGKCPGYFVVYEGDGRMIIRTHDRPGKGPKKTQKSDDMVSEDQASELQTQSAEDNTRHRFSVSGIKKLMKFKVDALGNYKELHTQLLHGLA